MEPILQQTGAKAIVIKRKIRDFDYFQMIKELQPRLSNLKQIFVIGDDVLAREGQCWPRGVVRGIVGADVDRRVRAAHLDVVAPRILLEVIWCLYHVITSRFRSSLPQSRRC